MSAKRPDKEVSALSVLRPLGLIKAVRRGKPNSTSRYDWYGELEEVFGQVVVLGLLIETGLVFVLPEPPWIKLLTLLSDICIAAGVYGELWAGKRTRVIGDELVESARARAEEARKETAELRVRAAQLEQVTAWRRLNLDQQKRLIDRMAAFPGISCDRCVASDAEAFNLLGEISGVVFSPQVGWVAKPPNVTLPLFLDGYSILGLFIGIDTGVRYDANEPELKEVAEALAAALRAEGIASAAYKSPETPAAEPRITILVGNRRENRRLYPEPPK